MFDRKKYFDLVRDAPFPNTLSQQQVDGQNAILTHWEQQYPQAKDLRWLGYMLATTYHETAYTMWPIEEYGKGQGKEYGKPDAVTGQTYYGRGFVQLTWKENYVRATDELELEGDNDLEWHPERALSLVIAADIMYEGMIEGWFTSHKLGDYFNDSENDPVNARIIINNDVKKNGAKIAGYYIDFLAALEATWTEPSGAETTVAEYRVIVEAPAGVAVSVTVEKVS